MGRFHLAICLAATFAAACSAVSASPPQISCDGFCGVPTIHDKCFCDIICTVFDDCCPDAVELCIEIPPSPPLPPPPPITCEGSCGFGTPFGCLCDEFCTFYGDCCPDVGIICGFFAPPLPPSPPPVTCEGFCGEFNPDGSCFCDAACTSNGDCCPDAVELCIEIPPSPPSPPSPPPAPVSCEGFCGEGTPFGCFCDDFCTASGDCCPGIEEICGIFTAPTSPPSPPTSCEGFCGGLNADDGCFCDGLCTAFDDCCLDAAELCLTPPAPPAGCPFTPGDANGDGVVSVLDVVASTNDILGLSKIPEESFCAADTDSDGDINITDIIAIAGIILA